MENNDLILTDRLRYQGRLLLDAGSFEAAEAMLRATLKIVEQRHGGGSLDAGLVLLDLIEACEKRGNHEDAQQLWERLTNLLQTSSTPALDSIRKVLKDRIFEDDSTD